MDNPESGSGSIFKIPFIRFGLSSYCARPMQASSTRQWSQSEERSGATLACVAVCAARVALGG